MCTHLKKTLDYLFAEHGIKVVSKVNGKSWGVGYLVDGKIPFEQIVKDKKLDGGVGFSEKEGLISCRACWENIAEHDRYRNNWS